MTTIYLVRHGESIANTESIYQGQTYDTDLSPLGKEQVNRLAKRFENIELSQIIASPLKRTWETARAVAKIKKLPIISEKRILEINHGEWEGKHKDMINKTWPDLYKKWQNFPSNVQFPKGERFVETQKRVITWWKEFLNGNKNDVLVVTHDGILRIIVAYALHMKLNRIWKFRLQSTSITVVQTDGTTAQLVELNDAKHLGDLQANLAIHAL